MEGWINDLGWMYGTDWLQDWLHYGAYLAFACYAGRQGQRQGFVFDFGSTAHEVFLSFEIDGVGEWNG